jgi:programmed cell death 6-interacting protein
MQKREQALQTMDMAYSKYRELSANLIEGLKFYNSLVKLMSELRDHIKQWHQSRQMDIAELSRQMKAASVSQASTSPVRPIASPAKRTTRSQARQSAAATEPSANPSAPQWGAWSGGDIRFAD